MRKLVHCFLAAAMVAPLSFAQDDIWDDVSPWETSWEAEATLVLSPDADDEAEKALFQTRLSGKAGYVFDNGVILGAAGAFEVQRDHPARAGFSGNTQDLSSSSAGQGAFSGLATGPDVEDVGSRGQLEEAYVWLAGGYGEARIGRDEGIAAQFYEGAPSVFAATSVANATLDPTGQNFIKTRHDLTGPANKISLTSPRLLGVKAGVSYTPEANVRGLDRDPVRKLPGNDPVELENATEIALNVSRRLPNAGPRLQGYLAWSQADVQRLTQKTKVETVSTGASIQGEMWRAGASYLTSDNGFDGLSGDYTAWHIGASRDWKAVTFSAGVGGATDDGAALDSRAWDAGVAYTMEDAGLTLSAGVRSQNTKFEDFSGGSSRKKGESLVIEITQRF